MMMALIPTLVSNAATADQLYTLESDSVTLDDWKNYFGTDVADTENAGRIWNDKSVFTDPSILGSLVDIKGNDTSISVGDNNFLVALSSIAANKSIVGYSHIPTDTVIVLDISGSMGPGYGSQYNDAVADMVTAANAAITSLQSLNNHNRVGIVLYSASSQVLLPLDRYSTTSTETYNNGTPRDPSDDKIINVYLNTNGSENQISIAENVKNGKNENVETKTVNVTGGTYTQSGIDTAMDVFLNVPESDTVISGSDFQSGTERKPVVVLMSDGAPTYATSNFTNVSSRYNVGTGTDTSNNIRFLTQLTAAYAKARISEHYNDSETLFYTLGLGGMSSVLDPERSSTSEKNLWNSFVSLKGDESLLVSQRAVYPTPYITSADAMYYVTDSFEATSKDALYSTFEKIVNQIIIQSLYSPTNISTTNDFSGFITFTDTLGKYMEVKDIKGILFGSTLFTGAHFAEAAIYGASSVDASANIHTDFVRAVIQRMGLDQMPDRFPTYDSRAAEARSLINLAYTHGQIAFDRATGSYSNYIGWYADENGNYLGFWDPHHTHDQIPDNAVYTNKCYGMLGTVKDGYRESDMLYITIQVHTEIATGNQSIVFKIPSSLIPVISYNVTIEGTSLENAGDISVEIDTTDPIRLIYEVGLRSDINTLNITEKVDAAYRNADGSYTFYTNDYDNQIILDAEQNEDEDSHIGEPGVNTFSNFHPSLENERYYYNVDTPIYVRSGNTFTPYKDNTAPGSVDLSALPLYRAYTHFRLDSASGEWHLYTDYAQIHHATLVSAERYTSGSDAGIWYIPAGTIHHNLDARESLKADGYDEDNLPDSVNEVKYVTFPIIHEQVVHEYHIDVILGNNAKLTATPATAIKLTKTVDDSITDLNYMYYFIISGVTPRKLVQLVRESADGTLNYSSYSSSRNGTIGVYVRAGESVYLTDMDEGSYTITESYSENDNFHVKSISVNGSQVSGENVASVSNVVVENRKVTSVSFENTLGTGTPQESYLVISKTVTHDFGDDYVIDAEKTFPLSIDLGSSYADQSVEIHSTKQSAAISKTADANGVVSYDITHGEHIALSLRVGTTVNVTENLGNDYPGFNTPVISYTNGNLSGDAAKTVIADSNIIVSVVNDYDASPVNPVNVTINATKVLEGRDWLDTDEFTFELQRYSPHDASYDTIGSLTATRDNKTLDFTSMIKNYAFDRIGQYHFRVIEVASESDKIGGITYDLVGRYFNVVVTDDLSGRLAISDVQTTSQTSVTQNSGTFEIVANDVVNVYAPMGSDGISVTINKNVVIKDAPAGVTGNFDLSGFEFGLYGEDGELAADPFKTDAAGNAVIKLTFDANDAGSYFDYTVKEIIPANDTAYEYDTTEYKLRINVIDNLDGTVSAVISVYDEESASYVETASGDSASLSFTNKYVILGNVSKTLNIQKIMKNLGTKLHGAGGFEFELRDETGALIGTFVSDDSGKASFTLEYGVSDIGKTYTYTLAEKAGSIANMDYSDTVYTISASVTLSADNELGLEVSVKNSQTAHTGDFEFTNVYDEDIPPSGSSEIDIYIEKSVSIKGAPAGVTGNLSPEGFEFVLTDENGNEIGKYKVDANGNAKITLTFTAAEHVGNTYYYVLKEVIPNDNLYEYDATEYKFSIKVVDNRDGTISAKLYSYSESSQLYEEFVGKYVAEFENKLIVSDNARVIFTIVKKIESTYGFDLSPEGFVFILRDAATGEEIGRLTTDENGKATFDCEANVSIIGYSASITVEEYNDGRENVVYSTEKYTLTASVELDANNKVVIVYSIKNADGQDISGTELEFTNVYNYNEVPPTGDRTLVVGAIVALTLLLGAAVVFTRKRRTAE